MHPGSKDYTQRVIAWSILLDDNLCGLVEEFLWLLRRCQFERQDPLSPALFQREREFPRRLVEPGSSANELVKTGGCAED